MIREKIGEFFLRGTEQIRKRLLSGPGSGETNSSLETIGRTPNIANHVFAI